MQESPSYGMIAVMAQPGSDDVEVTMVAVRARAKETTWELKASRDGRNWFLELTSPEESWIGRGPDCFEALRDLRTVLDTRGIKIGVNGARPHSWASGMQRDIGEGRVVYLCQLGSSERPPTVRTLDAAPLDEVGTLAEQDAFQTRWRAERGSLTPRLPLLKRLFRKSG